MGSFFPGMRSGLIHNLCSPCQCNPLALVVSGVTLALEVVQIWQLNQFYPVFLTGYKGKEYSTPIATSDPFTMPTPGMPDPGTTSPSTHFLHHAECGGQTARFATWMDNCADLKLDAWAFVIRFPTCSIDKTLMLRICKNHKISLCIHITTPECRYFRAA